MAKRHFATANSRWYVTPLLVIHIGPVSDFPSAQKMVTNAISTATRANAYVPKRFIWSLDWLWSSNGRSRGFGEHLVVVSHSLLKHKLGISTCLLVHEYC